MGRRRIHPPWLGQRLLSFLIRYEEEYSGSGDLSEEFEERVQEKGKTRTLIWYWGQVLYALSTYLRLSAIIGGALLKNYIKITLRHIKRYKTYTFLNIFGLIVGFTCSFLIFLYVRYELSYDQYHENAETVYRVVQKQTGNVWLGTDMWNATSGMLKPTLLENFPEVVKAVRVYHRGGTVYHNKNYFLERRFFIVEPEFLEIFTFPLVKGDPGTCLSQPRSILLTEVMALKYFGNEDPMGKTFTVSNIDYMITGILKDIPKNSHFTFDFLASFSTIYSESLVRRESIEQWGNNHYSTYIQLRKGVDTDVLEEKITGIIKDLRDSRRYTEYHLQPITDIHLHSRVNREFEPNSDIRYVYIFSAIAFLLLLIASFNYMNLSTAQAFFRAKEVGIRKVIGANRRQVSLQFLGEAVLFALIALVVSYFLIQILLPSFSSFVQRDLDFNLVKGLGVAFLFILIAFLAGVVSGSYPAIFLSALHPLGVLGRSKAGGSKKSLVFRNTLVVAQFIISISMIISTMVLYRQLNYIKNRNLGFEKENIVNFYVYDRGLRNKYETFRNELIHHQGILDLTGSSSLFDYNSTGGSGWWEGKQENENINFYRLFVDDNFFDFYGIRLLEGRFFSREMATDQDEAFILNETAVKSIGWVKPLGKLFRHWTQKKGEVIGVVDDFHFQSLRLHIESLVITLHSDSSSRSYFSVKLKAGDVFNTLKFIEAKYKEFSPGYPFSYSFLDDRLNDIYLTERRLGLIFSSFTGIAIIVSCLGLFGLGSFTAEKRTKEIGIRKVLGASIFKIVFMLSKEFIRWIILAAAAAVPIAWYAMNKWLDNFAYRINIRVNIFVLAFFIALLISFLSVGYKSYKAAAANPVNCLRDE